MIDMPRVNPDILIWARESAGLSREDAARALGLAGPERLADLESGQREPTRAQLNRMADKYRRSLVTFYLPRPPAAAPRTHDFRTMVDREPDVQARVEALVREIKVRQAIVRGALEEVEEADPLPFVGSVQGNQGPRLIAATILQTLRFNLDEYRRQPTIDAAFRLLREAVESIGVYVMLMGNLGHHTTNISPRVFRGFALADDVAPFIVINENDSHSAWTFTLIHELAHVFLGQSGISGYDGDQDIEQLCDEVAACFLLRPGELQEIDARRLTNDALVEKISEFARTRRVSRKMVAFNLRKTGAINWDRYQELSARFDAERLEAAGRPQRDGAPDYYVVRRHRMGPGLTRLVERMIGIGVLTSTKAGRILGVNPTAVGRMAASNRAA